MPLTASDARHLLRRAGYGGLPAEVATLTGMSRTAAVDHVMSTAGAPSPAAVPAVAGTSRTSERRALASWWVEQMTTSPAPIIERLTYFWHSHFACSSDRVKDQRNMRDQHVLFRQLGAGAFGPLLHAIAIDPAMLIDLDNASNVAGDEQENFARELLELYTIGNGMFSEDEVVSVARAWTGHNLADGAKPPQYQFHSNRHDKHDKVLFGITQKWDGPDVVDALVTGVREDQTAWFLATKLWREFGDPSWGTAELISALADEWKSSGHSALAVIRAIFLRDEFWAPERRFAVVKQPLAWLVELQRRSGVRLSDGQLDQRCDVLGQRLFLPPSVAGWGHNSAWLSAASLLARGRVAKDMAGKARELGWFSGLGDLSPSAGADLILDRFGVPDASTHSRAVVEAWHTNALAELSDYWIERDAFRVGAMLPEVNLA